MGGARGAAENTRNREAILEAAEHIMLTEGYAAVSTRRLATHAGVNSALVYYYFKDMDDLFVQLFRRGSDTTYQRQLATLSSEQPLWSLWELVHDAANSALTMEFIALANHRKVIRTEIARSSQRFRDMQVEAVSRILKEYDTGPGGISPLALILLMASVSRFLRIEESFGLETGHAEAVQLVEDHLRALEGERHRT